MKLERVDLHFYVYSSGVGNLDIMIAFKLFVTLLRFIIQHCVADQVEEGFRTIFFIQSR